MIVGTDLPDTIDGAGGNDVICGLEGEDNLAGGEGDDRLFGGLDRTGQWIVEYWADEIKPGPGDDFVDLGLDPNAGSPVVVDKEGNLYHPTDVLSFGDSATGVDVDLTGVDGLGRAVGEGTDTIVVAGVMSVLGSAHDDRITGSPYGDTIWSGRGNDVLSGGDGDDKLNPDMGASKYDDYHGLVDEREDREHVSPDTVHGGAGDDTIWSWWGPVTLVAGDGNDSVVVIDELDGHGTADGSQISGGNGDDSITALSVRGLQVRGGDGDDQITHDVFALGEPTITDGGRGDDLLTLGSGTKLGVSDRITVDRRRSHIQIERTIASMSGYEHHTLSGPRLNWVYLGTGAKDDVTLRASRSLRAQTFGGRDRVVGTNGRDVLDLGPGVDTVAGRGGPDICLDAERAKSCEVRRR
ncbi:hypothetical protein [Nocardioides sp.]|uniref:calcium-binding protein n=1 Tax=Nocardioides sp. TaxID=35761 RepID=UPI002C2A6F3E|nr:hypothetical protein [Nocardioides sp.]HXH80878.1 hypothetical protein [Nocardioides sp.]